MKRKVSIYITGLITGLFAILFYQCSTEKNTPVSRSYHNLTSCYNILFNGQESFNKGLKRYREEFQYDFTRQLPLFEYGNEELSGNIQRSMERTITKCSKVIKLHSITSKPENLEDKRKLTEEEKEYYEKSEFNKFADDAYLLMGKAYFWQMKYQTAANVLAYAAREFKDPTIKYKSQIWLARCYIELGQFRESGEILKGLEQDNKMPSSLNGPFLITYADHYIKQKQPKQAIPHLKAGIDQTMNKEKKAKYAFIMAQLYEENGVPDQAFNQYERVINMNPAYKMEFNAKLKLARLHNKTNRNGERVKRVLKEMLKQDKNEDYLDQIYFALGNIAFEENNLSKAIDYYKQSVTQNTNNQNQKGLSYLSMADIFFQKKDYEVAQAYYDSALTSIEPDYQGYTGLYLKTQHLTDLVKNLNTIERQDSLQKVAQMPATERNNLINRLIEKQREEDLKKREEQQRQSNFRNQRLSQQNQNTNRGGEWYFYSPTAIQRGKAEFKRRWGNRELKDHWRISSKKQAGFGEFEQQKVEEEKIEKQYSKTNRKYYLQNIPVTDSAMQASEKMIQEAYFNVGKIYMNDLDNQPKAIETFQKLNEKYPENPFKLSVLYNLYKLSKNTGNTSEAESYKNKIIREFPESNHAKVLTNPNYFKELETKKNKVEQFYAQTLESYHNKNYSKVLDNCTQASEKFSNSEYLPKFKYLRALTIAQTRDIVSFRNSLKDLLNYYPGTDVARQAGEILTYLKKNELQQINKKFVQNKMAEDTEGNQKASQQSTESSSYLAQKYLYTPGNNDAYYFVVIANPEKIDIGRLKFDLINFNLDYFLQKDYNTTSQQFNEFYQIITVKRFENDSIAKKYYDLVSKREERVFSEIESNEFRYFYISVKNYLTLLDKKSIIEYINYFNENVLARRKDEAKQKESE